MFPSLSVVVPGLVLFVTADSSSPASSPSSPARFQGLGFLATGDLSWAVDISADGSVVVGSSKFGGLNDPMQAFVWTEATGMVGLGDLDGGMVISSNAQAVSADGSVVVGYASGDAFRWTASGGMEDLGEWGPLGISADGQVIVGYANAPGGRVAVRWTAQGGLEDLGSLPGSNIDAFAADASADGSALVGQSWSGPSGVEPIRWTPGAGMVGLGDLPGGEFYGLGFAISDDGNTLAGEAISDVGWEAFRWTRERGLESLDPVGSLQFSSFAHGVSADGELIAGVAEQVGGASLWDEAHGFRSIAEMLESAGVDLGGWHLSIAEAVARTAQSAVVVGYGINPQGDTEAWIAEIPLPVFRTRGSAVLGGQVILR